MTEGITTVSSLSPPYQLGREVVHWDVNPLVGLFSLGACFQGNKTAELCQAASGARTEHFRPNVAPSGSLHVEKHVGVLQFGELSRFLFC